MPTPTKGPRLGGGPAHERLILANLATQLFEHQRITTTEAKAKRVRPLAERLITFAKRGDLASRRRVMTVVKDKGVVHVLFTDIAPQVAERKGGYTRITKIGPRKGDNAPMAVIELVLEPVRATTSEAEAATRRAASGSGAPAAAPADLTKDEPTPEATDGASDVTTGDASDVSTDGASDVTTDGASDVTADGTADDASTDGAPADAVADGPADAAPEGEAPGELPAADDGTGSKA